MVGADTFPPHPPRIKNLFFLDFPCLLLLECFLPTLLLTDFLKGLNPNKNSLNDLIL